MALAYTMVIYSSPRISQSIGSAQNFTQNIFGMCFVYCPCSKITPDVDPYSLYLIVASRRIDSRQQWRHATFSYSRLARRNTGMLARNVSIFGLWMMGHPIVSSFNSSFLPLAS
jgi:hypothetical protein